MRHRIQEQTIEAIKQGDMTKAHAIVTTKCKTKPEEMAYRVGRIVGALVDPDGFHKQPDLAQKFLEQFKR